MTKRRWLDILLISAATLGILTPSLWFGFVNLDDNFYVTNNIYIRHISFNNIIHFLTSFHHGVYAPVQYFTYMLLYGISGYHASVYHLTVILFHILSGIMVYFIIDKILHDRKVAFFSSFLFLIAPVNIDSAVWISELKNPQSLFFFLTAFYLYTVFRTDNKIKFYVYSIIAFLFGLLVKPPGSTLLIMMFVYDLINGRKIRNSVTKLLPYALIALPLMIIYMTGQSTIGSYHGLIGGSIWPQIKTVSAVAGGIFEYPIKLIIPTGLSVAYPIDTPISNVSFGLSLLAIVLIIIGIRRMIKRKDLLPAFWSTWYFANMLPYYGIIAMPFFADWYLYIPSIGLYTVMFIYINRLKNKKLAYTAVAIIIFVFAFLGFKRQFVWKNNISMWTSSLNAVGHDPYILRNLSVSYFKSNLPAKGIQYGNMLLRQTPDFVMMKYLIAKGYADTHRYNQADNMLKNAIKQLDRLEERGNGNIAVMPGLGNTPSILKAMIYTEMADIKLPGNHTDQAVSLYNKAVKTALYAPAYKKLAYLYVRMHKINNARNILKKLLALKPLEFEAWRMLGYITAHYYNNYDLASRYFRKSLEIAPDQKHSEEIKLLLKQWKTKKQ